MRADAGVCGVRVLRHADARGARELFAQAECESDEDSACDSPFMERGSGGGARPEKPLPSSGASSADKRKHGCETQVDAAVEARKMSLVERFHTFCPAYMYMYAYVIYIYVTYVDVYVNVHVCVRAMVP